LVDDVRLGTSGDEAAKLCGKMNTVFPKIKARVRQTGHTILGFTKAEKGGNHGYSGYKWQGGKGWSFYSSVRMRIEPSDVVEGAFSVTLDKCKVAPTQKNEATLILRDGLIDEELSIIRK